MTLRPSNKRLGKLSGKELLRNPLETLIDILSMIDGIEEVDTPKGGLDVRLEGITVLMAVFFVATCLLLGGLLMGMFIFEHVAQI